MSMQRLHPLSAVIRIASSAVNGFLLPTFAALALSGPIRDALGLPAFAGGDLVLVVGPLGAAIGATYGYLTYRRFAYELTEDTMDVAAGVLGRTEREIPIRRIQNVDVQQNVLHQVFDVAVVRIESAGGGSTEATLSVVGIDEARRLQRGIRERRARLRATASDSTADEPRTTSPDQDEITDRGDDDTDERENAPVGDSVEPTDRPDAAVTAEAAHATTTTETETSAESTGEPARDHTPASDDWRDAERTESLLSLKLQDILVLAATNFRLGSLIFVLFGLPFAGNVVTNVLVSAAEPFGGPTSIDPTVMTPDQYFVLGGVAGPLVLVGGYVLSAILAVLEYYDFELGRRGEDLVYERGLLQRYSGSIPTDKIQTLTVRETAPMRWLGYAALDVETAGYAGSGGGGTQAAVPISSRRRVGELAHELFDFDAVDLERPPKRARQRYAFRYTFVVLAVVAAAYALSTLVDGFTLWYLPALAVLAVPAAAHLKWRHRGYALTDDHVVVRTGFWRRRTAVVPYYRLQTVVSAATVFQRRRHLASVVADTASSATLAASAPTAHDVDADTARTLQRELRARLREHLGNR
jgi:putative membrane protein